MPPPFTITPAILDLVARIAERVGHLGFGDSTPNPPTLRRAHRIRSIHASLAIENNTLSLEQVTALVDGKGILGPPKEIREVRNAFATYEALPSWSPDALADLLAAHHLMMDGLVKRPGAFRTGHVGIAKGEELIHLAPPAANVPGLMRDLLGWLTSTDSHPLVTSCVFHYELEFIHPFSDGNGRMGRLWQTLILSHWKPALADLPVEEVIRERQQEYYDTLAACDKVADSTAFIQFALTALLDTLESHLQSDQVGDQVSDQVKKLLKILKNRPLSATDGMKALGLSHRPTFRENYLNPALKAGLIERTIPDKPNSRLQKYRLKG